jgi:hypothetical protein
MKEQIVSAAINTLDVVASLSLRADQLMVLHHQSA